MTERDYLAMGHGERFAREHDRESEPPYGVDVDRQALRRLALRAWWQRDVRSVLVHHEGNVAFETYLGRARPDTLQPIWSVTKSLISLLLGIAIDEGLIRDTEQPLAAFFPAGHDRASQARASIRIADLLEMRSGLAADDGAADSPGSESRLMRAADPAHFALGLPVATARGTRFSYASANTIVLGQIIASVAGMRLEQFARERLFEPLGIRAYRWHRASVGDVYAHSELWLRPRDLLRIGALMVDGGQWVGRAIVSRSWIARCMRASSHWPRGSEGAGRYYAGYGYHWWTGSGEIGPRAVEVAFASGSGGQKLFVVPAARIAMVVTRASVCSERAQIRSHELLESFLKGLR